MSFVVSIFFFPPRQALFSSETPKLKKKLFLSYRREHIGVRHDQPQVDVDGRHDPGLELEVTELDRLDLVEAQDEGLELGGLARGGLYLRGRSFYLIFL